MSRVENLEINVDVDVGDAIRDIKALEMELGKLKMTAEAVEDTDIDFDVDGVSAATAEVAALEAQTEAMEESFNNLDFESSDLEFILDGHPNQIGIDTPELDKNKSLLPGDQARRRNRVLPSGGDRDGLFKSLRKNLSGLISSIGDDLDNILAKKLRMEQFHNLMANLLPLLMIFVGAMPAAIVGIGTLAATALAAAAGLAAIGGLGLVGLAMSKSGGGMPSGEAFQEIFTELKKSLFEVISPIAERLAPDAKDALGGIVEMARELALRFENNLAMFRQMARGFGQYMMTMIPRAMSGGIRLLKEFKGVFGEFAQTLKSADITGFLIEETKQALPTLRELGAALIDAVPTIIDMSQGFLNALPIIASFIGLIADAVRVLTFHWRMMGLTTEQMTTMVAVGIAAVSIFGALNRMMLMVAGKGLVAAVRGVYGMITSVMGLNLTLLGTIKLLSAITVGLFAVGAAAGLAAANWDKLTGSILNTNKKLKGMSGMSGEFSGSEFGGGNSGQRSYGDVNETTINSTLNYEGDNAESGKRASNNSTYRTKTGSGNRYTPY